MWVARIRSVLGMVATAFWCTLALVLRPFWKRSVEVFQPYFARSVLWLAGIRVRVHQQTGHQGPVVYAANHQSGLDILVLMAWLPDGVRFVAKKEMAHAPFIGWCMRAADYVFIDRRDRALARESLQRAGASLRQDGRSVIIFPEGTRQEPGALGPFKMGAVHLAMEAGLPLVPVGIRNSATLMERGSLVGRAGTVDIHLGAPLDPHGWEGHEHALRDALRAQVKMLGGSSTLRDAPEALPRRVKKSRGIWGPRHSAAVRLRAVMRTLTH
jgi:1-acyl-sn-glycerol-3-phosphate acyltransferase